VRTSAFRCIVRRDDDRQRRIDSTQVKCSSFVRAGQYRLARLAERYGADIVLTGVLEALSADCDRRKRHGTPGIERCGARFVDLVDGPAPELLELRWKGTVARDWDGR
jgi:hypothetical protein